MFEVLPVPFSLGVAGRAGGLGARLGVTDGDFGDFLAADDPRPDRGVPPFEVLGGAGSPYEVGRWSS